MRPPILLSFVLPFLLLLLTDRHALAGETLHSMCNFLGGDYVNYDYCVSTLSYNPASSTADGYTLALISVNLTVTNATAIRSLADSLSLSTSNNSVRASLNTCSSLYAAANPDLLLSLDAAASHNYTAATTALSSVLRVPAGCDEAFVAEGAAVASPFRKENDAFSDLATLAKAVNNFMAH